MKQIFFIIFAFLITGCGFYQNQSYKSVSYEGSNLLEAQLRNVTKKWSKTPYVLGGTSHKKGADCSAFTQNIFAEFSTPIPRTTSSQQQIGVKVDKKNLRTGDLVFFKTGRGPNGKHVGIYTSNNKFIHLSTRGGTREVSLDDKYWKSRYIGARRVGLNNTYSQNENRRF